MRLVTAEKMTFSNLLVATLGSGLLFLAALAQVGTAKAEDPLVAFKYGLERDGRPIGFFEAVSGIGSESEVIEHKVVDDKGNEIIRKLPGRLDWTEVTLRRGINAKLDIWQWRRQVESGNIEAARSDVSIIAYNQSNEEIARWYLLNAWPKKIIMRRDDQEQLIEEMVLISEGVVREKVSGPVICTDFDEDGDVDGKDLSALAADFRASCLGPFAASFGTSP